MTDIKYNTIKNVVLLYFFHLHSIWKIFIFKFSIDEKHIFLKKINQKKKFIKL